MAIEIGSLVVELSANVARLAQDMDKARGTVDRAMGDIRRMASAATTALGMIGVGVSVAGFAGIIRGAIDANAALDDMAEKTGATVESLSALSDVARIGGHEMNAVEAGMVRLTKALAGGDDEAKAAGHALEALGLKAADLRNMDTGAAMLEVARALDKYADSGGKTALVLDLLGKNGAALLPFLKDLAEKGGLVAKVTAQEAAEAEKLQKQFNELKVAGDDMGRSLASITVPALLKVAENFRAAREAGYGFWQSLTGIGVRGLNESGADARNNAGARIKELMGERDEIRKALAAGVDQSGSEGDTLSAREKEIERKLAFYRALQRDALAGQYGGAKYMDARDLQAQQKGSLSGYTSPSKDKNAGKSGLEKMLETGQKNLMEDYYKYSSEEISPEDWRKLEEASTRASKKAADDLEKLRQKYIDLADPLQKYREQLDEINRLRESGVLTAAQATEAEWAVNEAMDEQARRMAGITDEIKKQDDIARQLGMTFTSAFEDAMIAGKDFGTVLKGIGDDIARIVIRKNITEPLAGAVAGFDWKKLIPSFDVGTPYVPQDTLAFVHRGEAIIPAQYNNGAAGGITVNQTVNIDARSDQATIMAAMVQAKNAAVRAIAESQRRGGAFA